jgi:hypothetical protein
MGGRTTPLVGGEAQLRWYHQNTDRTRKLSLYGQFSTKTRFKGSVQYLEKHPTASISYLGADGIRCPVHIATAFRRPPNRLGSVSSTGRATSKLGEGEGAGVPFRSVSLVLIEESLMAVAGVFQQPDPDPFPPQPRPDPFPPPKPPPAPQPGPKPDPPPTRPPIPTVWGAPMGG